jgi:zinc transporter
VSHALTDDEGLVCAFQLAPFARRNDLNLRVASPGTPMWFHLNLNDARARRWLQERAQLPAEAREPMLAAEARTHAEVLPGGGLVAVLADLDHDFHGGSIGFHHIRVFLDETHLITGRRHPLRSVDLLRRELQTGAVEVASPISLFERLVEALAHTLGAAVSQLGDEVDDAEEQILGGHLKHQGATLGRIRRALAQLRRHLHANRAALAPVPGRLPPAYTNQQRQDLRQAIERLTAVSHDLELVQERARLLQEEIANGLTEVTNRNLFVLSIVTTILLPITLITGIFGMNVGGLPWVGDAGGFWWVMLVMVSAFAVTLGFLRRRGML